MSQKLWKILRDGNTRQLYLSLEKHCMQVKKQQLELDMEKWTVSKLRKELVMPVYCHPAYLTYVQSTSWTCGAGLITSWNQDCQEKYQQHQIYR